MNDKARAAVYAMAGVYMLYMAYQIFGVRMDNGGSDFALMLTFSIIFLLVGLGFIGFAIYMMKKK
ncbi:MAG: hypothetical protein IJ024_07040 [Lachnospiraceae bacterium]|nr:hypothetical protein [Lachnospiraceae bacterium]